MKTFKTPSERDSIERVCDLFDTSRDSTQHKLDSFPRYVGKNVLKRFLCLYEIFKLILTSKGSIVECGVYGGFGLMAWAKLSAILEPENLTRRVYGFDSFAGFPAIGPNDCGSSADHRPGDLRAESIGELAALIKEFDRQRCIGHIDKVHLIAGDACATIPDFVSHNQHLLISLLFLDFDLYEPTRVALQQFLPRMAPGAIVAFDELDNPQWPGETTAYLECAAKNLLGPLERMPWDPYIAFARVL